MSGCYWKWKTFVVENLGPLSGQKTTVCHLERLDPKVLRLGRSGTVEGEAAGADTGELNEVCILNGDPGVISCLNQADTTTIHSLSLLFTRAFPPNRRMIGGAFSRETDQPREKYLLKWTFGGVPPPWNFQVPAHPVTMRPQSINSTYKHKLQFVCIRTEGHKSSNVEITDLNKQK